MTDNIIKIVQDRSFSRFQELEDCAFRFTFAQLAESLGEDSFKKFDRERNRYSGAFLISAFEPIAMGLGYNFESYASNAGAVPDIATISKELWSNSSFLEHSGSGVRASSRIPFNIPLGREFFAPCE